MSQEEIAAEIGAEAPNKVTIYRALESFVEKDIVHKAFLQDRTWHFELGHNCSEHQCHPHCSCTGCGQTHCMTGVSVPMAENCGGYVIEHQRVQLEGLCPKCSKPMRIIAFIQDPPVIEKILHHIGEPTRD